MYAHAEVFVQKAPEHVFDFATANDTFPKVLLPVGPIPGIRGQELDTDVLRTGTKRRVFMTDGSTVEEEVLSLERPRVHHYQWLNRPAFPFSLLVKTGEAVWTFRSENDGTRIQWDYTLGLTSPLAYPAMLIVRELFRRWMQQGLEGVRRGCDGA
jgi:hypothetical protein